MSISDEHTWTGVYALDALSAQERHEVEGHFAGCAACAQEVREFEATAARVGASLAVTAPPALRARVLAAVASTPQERPPGPSARPRPEAARPAGRHERAPSLRWAASPLALAAAVLAALALGLGALAFSQAQRAQRAERAQALADRIASVATDPSRVINSEHARTGGAGSVVAARDDAIFTAAGLSTPPPGRTYQLWLIGPSGIRSAGVLATSPGGRLYRFVTGVGDAVQIGLSVEPSGGSRQPTTTPLLVIPLRA